MWYNIGICCRFYRSSYAVKISVYRSFAAPQPVQTGQWEDGSAIAWQCSNKTNMQVKFMFKTADGTVYQGILTCGETI